MSFLLPAGFLLLGLALPILLLYMLKLRRRQVEVSSTLLWTQLLRDRQANAPWQKLRRNLLLILQLAILAAMVLAFARPVIRTPVVASGSVIVLLDGSASMNATDVSPSRFEAARRAAQNLVNGMAGNSRMTLILVNRLPRVLAAAEEDRAVLKNALAGARVSQQAADWQAAFALAAGAAYNSQDATTVIISDGGLPAAGLPSLPGKVSYIPVGEPAENVAITALALRPSTDGPQLFAEVTDFGRQDHVVLLSIYFGDRLLSARQLEIPAGSSRSLTLDGLPAEPGIYRAHISPAGENVKPDALALDDTAFAVYQASSLRRVLLVSRGNLFLEQLLASIPGIQPFKALPGEDGAVQIPNSQFDLYVLDGIVPNPLPSGSLLFVNPSSNALFEVGAPFKDMSGIHVHEGTLTQYVDWSNVHVLQASSVTLPPGAEVVVESAGGPLVFAGDTGDRRIAALTFDLRQSDLPLQLAYPILLSNLINYLVPPAAFDASQSLAPGDSLLIRHPPGAQEIAIAAPSGRVFSFGSLQPELSFTETDELGYYAVNFLAGETVSSDFFAVNLFDPAESAISSRPAIQVGSAAVSAQPSDQVGQRELWQWLAGLALAILLIEWQVYHRRRIILPSRSSLAARWKRLGAGR